MAQVTDHDMVEPCHGAALQKIRDNVGLSVATDLFLYYFCALIEPLNMKKLHLILALLAATLFAQAQTIEHLYHYNQPVVSERDGYQQIGFQGCLPIGQVGEPSMPWQSVSLMLPQGQEAVSVKVEFFDYVELEGSFNLYPYQRPRTYSNENEIPFAKKENVYRSENIYPTHNFSAVNTQYLNGVAFAFCGFTPVQYVPATGKVSYAKTVKVSIETTTSRDDHSRKLWLTSENEASIKRLAQNTSLLSTYNSRGRVISGYDMLVITSEEWVPHFDEYLSLYNDKGIRTRIISLEEIYAAMDGRDEQEQIRNYIIQEYEENGISMVSLGGDVSIVPYRSLYCWAQEDYEDHLPSDMYYACLDGTLNDNGNDRWGEVGEDDLLPELGIGRLPFNNATQFENIMHKTFSYLQTPVLGEFASPILGAEHLGDGYYGSDDLERLIGTNSDFDYTTTGYSEDYDFKRYYATPSVNWNAGAFRRLIGKGGQYVHHVGHANSDYVAGWDGSSVTNDFFSGNDGINHNYMIFHSHGCICGNFPVGCILEKMVTVRTGFVVTTGNSRYGWYVPWGDGMAAHIHREFVDAYCNDHIAILSMALREAKIATAPWVTMYGEENGCLRWNIYCLNVLGDGTLYPWFEEPFNPNVTYEKGLKVGTTSTQVHVDQCGKPLDNFRVSLFDGEDLLAFNITDENGNAELTFATALDKIGEMKLIVTGQSAWPQILEVTGFDINEPYIYGNIIDIEGGALFGSQHAVMTELFNNSDVAAHHVHAAITTDSEYITVHDTNFTIDEMAPNSHETYEQGGLIDIADNIPDQTIITLSLSTVSDETSNATTTQRSFLALAPNLQFVDLVLEETLGDGNGYLDPGEQAILHITATNSGHALAPEVYMTVNHVGEGIYIEETTYPVGNIDRNGNFSIDVNIGTDSNIVNGTTYHINLCLHTGAYTSNYDYSFSVGEAFETFESGDFSLLNWEHTGDQHWFVTDEEAHSGTYSARSGNIGDGEVTKLVAYADILNDGEISFWLKTSTEYRKDIFAFFMDGGLKDWWSGENDWTFARFDIEAGSHLLEWFYIKNGSGQSGSDCAWIDDITFPRTCTITAVEEVVEQKTSTIYPNPTNGSFTIVLTEESNISIFNALGQIVKRIDKVSNSKQIDLGNVSKGMYYVRIQSGKNVETHKLIID